MDEALISLLASLQCDMPQLAHHYSTPPYLDTLHRPSILGDIVATQSPFIKAILLPFR